MRIINAGEPAKEANMKFRWTMKELKEKTDDQIIRGIIAERMSDLSAYTPLQKRLQKIYNVVDKRIEQSGKN